MSTRMCAALDEALEEYETENQQSFFSKSKDVACEPLNDEVDSSMGIDKSTTVTFSENGEEDDMASSSNNDITTSNDDTNIYSEENLPKPLYNLATRVYAKDDATGLLYPAFIRKVMWGPKSNQVNLGFCSSLSEDGGILNDDNEMKVEEEEDDDEEDDEDKRRWGPKHNCYHYYVHYMGWAITWDRWVEETNLYEDSKSTESLSKLLHKEYNKVKPKKKGQKMSVPQINKWMQRMIELEAEHKKTFDTDEEDVMLTSQELYTNGKDGETDETMHEHFRKSDEGKEADMSTDTEEKEVTITEEKSSSPQPKKKLNSETLQKQAQLHKNGLQMKRKKSISDQLTLPFNLKKILVEEWEVMTQCGMVHNLPSKVSVRVALDQYLESKLGPLRKKQQEEEEKKDVDNNMQIDESNNKKDSQLGKEWIDMVEGIALFFDQALPIHLLFQQERGQYNYFRRQILAQRRNSAASSISTPANGLDKVAATATKTEDDNTSVQQQSTANLDNNADNSDSKTATAAAADNDKPASKPPPETDTIPERMSEIYGCEHILRLFTRLPSIVAESSSSSAESRRIFSKLGDLVRYLQKNQSVFQTSYRKPLPSEIPGKKKKRKAAAITAEK